MTHFAIGRTMRDNVGTSRGDSSATPMKSTRHPSASASSLMAIASVFTNMP